MLFFLFSNTFSGWRFEICKPVIYWKLTTYKESGKRGSNSRPPAWEASALPTELLPPMEPIPGLEPGTYSLRMNCSTNWAISAFQRTQRLPSINANAKVIYFLWSSKYYNYFLQQLYEQTRRVKLLTFRVCLLWNIYRFFATRHAKKRWLQKILIIRNCTQYRYLQQPD